jgi:cytochrome P450
MNHHLIEDDWYKGHFLPKDSVIMLNWWAIHYDEERYPDPVDFIPERYLNHTLPAADYIAIGDPYKRDHFTYGAGRRACPGVHVAEKSMVSSAKIPHLTSVHGHCSGSLGFQHFVVTRQEWSKD